MEVKDLSLQLTIGVPSILSVFEWSINKLEFIDQAPPSIARLLFNYLYYYLTPHGSHFSLDDYIVLVSHQ